MEFQRGWSSFSHCLFDHCGNNLFKRHTDSFQHIRKTAVRGKARNSIHFVKHDFPGSGQEHINPCKSLTIQSLIRGGAYENPIVF